MAKSRTQYQCQSCGARFPKWMGRCQECGEWNSVVEDLTAHGPGVVHLHAARTGIGGGLGAPTAVLLRDVGAGTTGPEGGKSMESPGLEGDGEPARLRTGMAELERVLGGGIPAGAVVLLGGDPGIGKSTLVLQVLEGVGAAGYDTLYISGEESASQIKQRAGRLGCAARGVRLLAEVELEPMLVEIERNPPRLVVLDSIQTARSAELDSAAGNVSQVRACAARLIEVAKRRDIAMVLIGHVTKEGALAGPRTLEHMVDVVLYLEGLEERPHRILRSVKNRFGASHEVGLFAMTARGLTPVENPSALFLGERAQGASGTVVLPAMEGTRPVLVEVQALVGEHASAYSRRTAVGVDPNRVALLQAVLEKHLGSALSGLDIYLNVAGGLRLNEPALDAAVAAAMLSSFRNLPVPAEVVVFGEVGLAGELRSVRNTQERLAEAARQGFTRALVPGSRGEPLTLPKGLRVEPVRTVRELAETLFPT
ncbi:MAG: DNA repair protein RadA [Deltaproteobacteria bacterium]|nr:DNA repair protein RadA [Deltaproteobacteria bacterium]